MEGISNYFHLKGSIFLSLKVNSTNNLFVTVYFTFQTKMSYGLLYSPVLMTCLIRNWLYYTSYFTDLLVITDQSEWVTVHLNHETMSL